MLLAALAWSRARGWGLLPPLPPTIAAFTLPGLILLGLAWGRADPTTALLLLLLLLLLAAFTLFLCVLLKRNTQAGFPPPFSILLSVLHGILFRLTFLAISGIKLFSLLTLSLRVITSSLCCASFDYVYGIMLGPGIWLLMDI